MRGKKSEGILIEWDIFGSGNEDAKRRFYKLKAFAWGEKRDRALYSAFSKAVDFLERNFEFMTTEGRRSEKEFIIREWYEDTEEIKGHDGSQGEVEKIF